MEFPTLKEVNGEETEDSGEPEQDAEEISDHEPLPDKLQDLDMSEEPALEDRILNMSQVLQRQAQTSDPETRDLLYQLSQHGDDIREDYGFTDRDVMHSGHVKPSAIEEAMGEAAIEAGENLTGGALPDTDDGAVDVKTYEILPHGELRENQEMSGPRYALAEQYRKRTGRDLRPVRYRAVFPPNGGLTEEARESFIPDKSASDEELVIWNQLQLIPKGPSGIEEGDALEMYQRQWAYALGIAYARLGKASPNELYEEAGQLFESMQSMPRVQSMAGAIERLEIPLEELDRVPVKSEPEMRCQQLTEDASLSHWVITLMDREEVQRFTGNAGDWHYLGGLLSDGGTEPGTNVADYRRWPYVAVTPKQNSPLYELIGLGRAYNFEDERPIVDGQGLVLLPEWPDKDFHALQFQLRAITDYGPDQQPTYSKGMGQPIRPEAIKEALAIYEQELDAEQQEYYQGAAKILRTALSRSQPTMVLVEEDQVKVGDPTTSGMALITSTYLRGTFDADTDDNPRSPYRIIGNPQLSQFLTQDGFELLKEHLREEKEILVEKVRTLPGIAELAGETTARKQKEILHGDGSYETSMDLLSDAILGGGIRMQSSDDWIAEMQGEKGQMCAPQTVINRFQRAAAAYIRRRYMRGLGIYGYGHHHMTCVDDQYVLRELWPTKGGKRYVQNAQEGLDEYPNTPLADPSAAVHPEPVSGLMGADDDGDIVTGIAANIEIEGLDGEPMDVKAIMHWRFPCVDVPVIWAVPSNFHTPWDPKDEEEAERHRRIIEIFGPEMREEDPTGKETALIEDRQVTMLHASNAMRLAGTGAREEINDESISKDSSEAAAWQMVERKRKLNRAGPLTRDLERLGQIAAEAHQTYQDAVDMRGPESAIAQNSKHLFKKVHKECGEVSIGTELQLIKHKKETERDQVEPRLAWPQLGYPDAQETRMILSQDYHNQVQGIHSLEDLEEMKLLGGDRHAQALNEILLDGPMGEIVEALRSIEPDRQPFLKAMEKRVRDYVEQFPESEKDEVWERLDKQRYGVRTLCEWYRSVWAHEIQKFDQWRAEASNLEAVEEKIEERTSEIHRALRMAMQTWTKEFSGPGLAWGVYHDWSVQSEDRRTGEMTYNNSTSAGMRLIEGRMGEVFVSPASSVNVKHLERHERHSVVYMTRDQGFIPIEDVGATREATGIRIREQDGRVMAYVDFGEKVCPMYFDDKSEAPPRSLEGAVESGETQLRVSRIAPRRGILRYRQNG